MRAPDPRTGSGPRLSIVTGAASGLGRAFAEQLASHGSDLFLLDRNGPPLEESAAYLADRYSVRVETLAADLSLADTPARAFERLQHLGLTADALFNNAGFNVYGRFEDSDLDRELEMIRLHSVATTQLTKLFLRGRDRERRNRILNVSSIAALVPGPFVSVHFATRAHLLSFSLALAEEFRGTDVDVTCLCPGPMATPFFETAGMTDVRLFSGWPLKSMSATEVATLGYGALMAGKRMYVPGRRNRLFAFAADVAPRPLKIRFARWVMDRVPPMRGAD